MYKVGFLLFITLLFAKNSYSAGDVLSLPANRLAAGQTQAEIDAFLREKMPVFTLPASREEWSSQAESLRRKVHDEIVFRGVPESWRIAISVIWEGELRGEGYTIRKLRFEIVPGFWVGGLLYVPDGLREKVPAVLNVNGHVGEPGMTVDYKQVRCINQVKRGVIALNLEWIGMGQLRTPEYAHNNLAYLDVCGVSGLAIFYLELQRGLDILGAHPDVDANRIAVTGLSGGGWQTIMISALDTRVKLSAPNAGYIGLENRIEHTGDIGDLEQNPCDLLTLVDYPHLTAMLVPRPALLIYNEKDDCCFAAQRARASVYDPIFPLYELFNAADRFQFHVNYAPGTHNYQQDNREAFYRFFNRAFLPENRWMDPEIPVENEIRSRDELAIEYPPDNGSFYSLAYGLMNTLPPRKNYDGGSDDQWRTELRSALKGIIRQEASSQLEVVSQSADSSSAQSCILRVNQRWSVPLWIYEPPENKPVRTVLLLSDMGKINMQAAIRESLSRNERVVAADLLFTGECKPSRGECWQFAQMISTVGGRPLGIQAAQVEACLQWMRQLFGGPLWMQTDGIASGLAALVCLALNPESAEHLRMFHFTSSLKNLLYEKRSYNEIPSLFCFGLLARVDIPEMIELTQPASIDIRIE